MTTYKIQNIALVSVSEKNNTHQKRKEVCERVRQLDIKLFNIVKIMRLRKTAIFNYTNKKPLKSLMREARQGEAQQSARTGVFKFST